MHFFGSNTFFECPNFQLILPSGESLKLIHQKSMLFVFLNLALVWMISMPIIFFIVCEFKIDYIVSNIYGLIKHCSHYFLSFVVEVGRHSLGPNF